MKNKYCTPLMEMRKFNKENIITASAENLSNMNAVKTELQTKMQEKAETAINKGVFEYNTGW